jgi:predicted transglutaminase-like cysteine proteinase
VKTALWTGSSATPPGIGFWRIVAWTGLLLVGALYVIDPIELLSSSVVPICFVAADSDAPAPTKIEINVTSVSAVTDDEGSTQLFGMDTELVTGGALLDEWQRVQADITKDLEIVAQCQAGRQCPAPAQRLISLSLEGAGRSGRARVGVLNRAVDLAISPVSDETQWGVPDHWSDPLETLRSNSGDCEDYAIVKYAALLAAGLSKDAVKIIVLKNRLPNEDHAVVAVRVDHQWLILDNRTLTLVRDTDVTRAMPEFVLDDQGVRQFIWSSRIGQLRISGIVLGQNGSIKMTPPILIDRSAAPAQARLIGARRLGCIDPPVVTRSHSWIFRSKPLNSNERILAQLEKFS